MPRMPFSGVRNSWLTVARKRDFASLAASALARASFRVRSAATRSVMSRPARTSSGAPSRPAIEVSTQDSQRTPSGVRTASSTTRAPSAPMRGAPLSITVGRSPEPISVSRDVPMSSAKRSFAKVMRPARSRWTMTSSWASIRLR